MVEFVNNQTAYLTAAASSAKALQAQIQDLALELGSSNSTQFPRKNSNSNNVPVNDILKVRRFHDKSFTISVNLILLPVQSHN